MRTLASIICLVTAASTAYAEPTDWAGFKLGAKPKKAKPVSATLYGCPGTVSVHLKKKKVAAVIFDVDMDSPCMTDTDPDALSKKLADAITADMGSAKPVQNGQGDTLWEGTGVSVILTTGGSGDSPFPEMWLVPADASGKRMCWPGDGFADFYKAFTAAVASGGDLAPYFKFPVTDETGQVGKLKKVGDLKKLLTDDSKSTLADPNTSPYCSIGDADYIVDLPDPHGLLTAVQVKGAWKFVKLAGIEVE